MRHWVVVGFTVRTDRVCSIFYVSQKGPLWLLESILWNLCPPVYCQISRRVCPSSVLLAAQINVCIFEFLILAMESSRCKTWQVRLRDSALNWINVGICVPLGPSLFRGFVLSTLGRNRETTMVLTEHRRWQMLSLDTGWWSGSSVYVR